HKDLTLANVSAWQQYTLAFPSSNDNGGRYYNVDLSNPNNPIITSGSRTKLLRQYFKFVRAGARRIGATSASASFEPVSFINTNGTYVVVVKANSGGSFSVGGLPA